MKKDNKSRTSSEIYETPRSKNPSAICPQCKEVVMFVGSQDSKLCPGCGTLILNTKS